MSYTFDSRLVSDLHKDAMGFRPTGDFMERWHTASDNVRQLIWDGMLIALERSSNEEAKAQCVAIEEFEIGVECELNNGAVDRNDAIRRLILSVMHESKLEYGSEYVCFKFGLPYAKSAEFDSVVAEMIQTAHI